MKLFSINKKKMKFKFIAFFTMIFMSTAIMAESKISDLHPVEWNEQITKVQLPEPFNEVIIKISKSDTKLEGIVITINKHKIRLRKDYLEDIENISYPEFNYGKADFYKDKKIDSFKIYFEYGYPELIELGDVPGCESPCVQSVRNVVIFTVDRSNKITREIINPIEETGVRSYILH